MPIGDCGPTWNSIAEPQHFVSSHSALGIASERTGQSAPNCSPSHRKGAILTFFAARFDAFRPSRSDAACDFGAIIKGLQDGRRPKRRMDRSQPRRSRKQDSFRLGE